MKALLCFALLLLAGCGGNSTSQGTGGAAGAGGSAGSGGAGGTAGVGGSAGTGGLTSCGPEAKKCSEPADCVLNSPSCCLCGQPELSDFEAINQSFTQQCSCQGPMCGCATMMNPNLAATCRAGSCEGFDVRTSDTLSGCASDSECTLRMGLSCCEACQGSEFELVAVKLDQTALHGALCGPGPVACDACVPQYPATKKAACLGGHCQVVDK